MNRAEEPDDHPRPIGENAEAFSALTGQTRDEFDRLFVAEADALRAACTYTKRGRRRRTRGVEADRRHTLAPRTRLLLALVWVRVYPTYELLGWLTAGALSASPLGRRLTHREVGDSAPAPPPNPPGTDGAIPF